MPGSGGRPNDRIWERFQRLDNKSKCNVCGHEAAANPDRMRKHFAKHEETMEGPVIAKDNFTIFTSDLVV